MKVFATLTFLSTALVQGICATSEGASYIEAEVDAQNSTITPRATDTYVTFYSDRDCKNKVGGVSYDVANTNCFSNEGQYVKPHCGPGGCAQQVFRIIKSPGDACNCQSQCFGFKGWHTGWCYPVRSLGHQWRMESDTDSCGPNNC